MEKADKPGRLNVVTILGGPKEGDGEEGGPSPKDLACKAMWKAIKEGDDYGAFKTALEDFLEYRQDASSATDD
jgi:hypothetical protein